MNKHLKSLIFAFNALDIVYHYGPIKLEMPSSGSDHWRYLCLYYSFATFFMHTLCQPRRLDFDTKIYKLLDIKYGNKNKTRLASTKELVC